MKLTTRHRTPIERQGTARILTRTVGTRSTRTSSRENLRALVAILCVMPLGMALMYGIVTYVGRVEARVGLALLLIVGPGVVANVFDGVRSFRRRSADRWYACVVLPYALSMVACSTYAVYVSVVNQWYVTLALSYVFALASCAGVAYLAWVVAYETGRLRTDAVPRHVGRD